MSSDLSATHAFYPELREHCQSCGWATHLLSHLIGTCSFAHYSAGELCDDVDLNEEGSLKECLNLVFLLVIC